MTDAARRGADARSVGDLLERVLNRLETLSGERDERGELTLALAELRAGLALAAPIPGRDLDPCISLDDPPDDAPGPDDLLSALAERTESKGRYYSVGEIGRGGMGVVLRVWDAYLRRTIARKSVHGLQAGSGSTLSGNRVTRFLEEAQVAAQLDHPGILPVHDIGVDDVGRPYFTMQLVRGRSLRDVYRSHHDGDEEWTLARSVGALLRVAEAMAYAHSKGVIHRDLKPANVMVGRFGEVYVMDWGLAKILDLAGPSDADGPRRVSTARTVDDTPSAELTVSGSAVGTPAYMAPEQAFRSVEALGPRADVYALGAMLYHLLAAAPPYADVRRTQREPTETVKAGPPTPLRITAAKAPPELVAIAERAMAREPDGRYPTMEALGQDLRAWLEGRVVSAFEGGAWAELRKWIGRNRALAGTALVATLALVVGTVTTAIGFVAANERADDVLRLSAIQDLEELTERAGRLWPAHPERLEELREWVRDAEALIGQRELYEARLTALRASARPPTADEREAARRAHPRFGELELARADLNARRADLSTLEDPAERSRDESWITHQEQIISALASEVNAINPWRFAAHADQWWHDRLATLIQGLDRLVDPEVGLLDGVDTARGIGIRRRIALAERLERMQVDETLLRRWQRAIASIADPEDCPAYGGLQLAPQTGLVPLRRNPVTQLWEFWHVLSGAEPEIRDDGGLALTKDTGIVLILIPAGRYSMGCQANDPGAPFYDPWSSSDERPVVTIELDPFFLSKYETTQAQWIRLTGSNPSVHTPGEQRVSIDQLATLLNPVEQVSWIDSREVFARFGLALPTEAQWEGAARAGTTTPWWCGANPLFLEGNENLADLTAAGLLPETDATIDDGFLVHARVDAVRPNPWGFFHMLGNVCEWCEDRLAMYEDVPVRAGTGERIVGPDQTMRLSRGGSFVHTSMNLRASRRLPDSPGSAGGHRGVRAARALERPQEDPNGHR